MSKVVTEDFELNTRYVTEGNGDYISIENIAQVPSLIENNDIVSGIVVRVLGKGDIFVKLGNGINAICRANNIDLRNRRNIRELSKMVGNKYDFLVESINDKGEIEVSRRKLQEEVAKYFLDEVKPGSIITGVVKTIKRYGILVDIGRGLIGVLTYKEMQLHKNNRKFEIGQEMPVVFKGLFDNDVAALSTVELLGTWEQNTSLIERYETRIGYVKMVTDYGAFITLAPNISGLADNIEGFNLSAGDMVSVMVRNISDAKMRVRLTLVSKLTKEESVDSNVHYFIDKGRIVYWEYEPENFIGERRTVPSDYSNMSAILGKPSRKQYKCDTGDSETGEGDEGDGNVKE